MRAAGAILAAAILTLPAVAQARQGSVDSRRGAKKESPSDIGAAFWAVLAPRAGAEGVGEVDVTRRLAKLGAEAVRPAIGAFLGDIAEPEHGYEVDPEVIGARPRILIAALKLLPRADVLREIDAAKGSGKDVDRNLALSRLLSEIGGKEAFDRVVAIAAGLDPVQWERAYVQVQLQDGIARLVKNETHLAREAARRVRDSKPGLAAILVRAIGSADAAATAPDLALAFGRAPVLDLCLAETLGQLGDHAAGSLPESALTALRAQLDPTDTPLACASAIALGRLGDEASARRLVRLLDEPEGMLKNAARLALISLAGQELPAYREPWETWLNQEEDWKAERLPELKQAIAEGGTARLQSIVSELVGHRLFRHAVATAMIPMLEDPNPDVARLACGILPSLGSRSVVPALQRLLYGADADLREAARAALIALTGESAAVETGSKTPGF